MAMVAMAAVMAAGPALLPTARAESCYPDCDESGELDFFDFLCFQNQFALQTPYADCDGSGTHDFFDFLCFQNAFAAGCSSLVIHPLGVELAPPDLCGVEVTAFPADPRPILLDVTTVESPLGGELMFDVPCSIRSAGMIGLLWGRGYLDAIYYTNGEPSVTISLPPNSAFYFYMTPNPFLDTEFEIIARKGGEQVAVLDVVLGLGEAEGFGICGSAETVTIRSIDERTDFAFGEFSIAD